MTKLIDSSEMTALLNKFRYVTSVRLQPNTPLINAVDIDYRSKILLAELLTWTNNLPKERKRKLDAITAMKELFLSAFFFNEFIKWLDYVMVKDKITLVELLDAYYSWFPFRPQSR